MSYVDLSRVPAYYHGYINQVIELDFNTLLTRHGGALIPVLDSLAEEKWDYRYASGKWSIREVVQHLIDAERIFCYRALCFSRRDRTPLPGFDENQYVEYAAADQRSSKDLKEELVTVQQSTVHLFKSFRPDQLEETGTANGKQFYVKSIAYIAAGHALHHLAILKERYLNL